MIENEHNATELFSDENNHLSQVKKKWNEEEDLKRWENHYYEDNYNGNRLRARENKVLEMLDKLNLPKKSKILELGYGAGITSAKIYSRGYNLTGIDISETLRHLAIKNCESLKNENSGTYEFQIGNAEHLNFANNSFDCVIGLGFLQYLEHPENCIQEVQRILKPNGYFILTQRNMYGISSIDGPLKWIRSAFYATTKRPYELRWQDTPLYYVVFVPTTLFASLSKKVEKYKQSLIQHKKIGKVRKNAFSLNRLKKLIEQNGLTVLQSEGAGYLTKKSILISKIAKKIDHKLQSIQDKKRSGFLPKIGNSIVFLAKKEKNNTLPQPF